MPLPSKPPVAGAIGEWITGASAVRSTCARSTVASAAPVESIPPTTKTYPVSPGTCTETADKPWRTDPSAVRSSTWNAPSEPNGEIGDISIDESVLVPA